MKLLTFTRNHQFQLGVKIESGIIDITAAKAALAPDNAQIPANLADLLAGGPAALKSLAGLVEKAAGQTQGANWLLDEAGLQFGPCVPNPGKIICVGLNYRRHAEETGAAIPSTPVLFSKFNSALAAPGEPVPLPDSAEKYDYEVELAVVMGQKTKHVSEADALNYVLGYSTANDVSARDLQLLTGQWLLGKTLDKFLPLGPYLVTAEEVGDPQKLNLQTWVNGELRQNSNTSDMIFTVAQIVSYISRYITLEPGDVIITGTPEGVILGMKEKQWLKPGDEVTVEVEKLGRLTNKMTGE